MKRIALLACLLLAACGQKGALYLPDESRTTITPASPAASPAAAPAAGAETEEQQRQRQQQQAAPAPNPAGN
jgi:predicted small lipoprotein YifL